MDEPTGSYPEAVANHIANPRNMGGIPSPDGLGWAARACGDSMQVFLRVRDGKVIDAKFMTEGCGPMVACGSVMTEMVKERPVADALGIDEDDIMQGLKGLPESERHCATVAVVALRQALRDYLSLQREPWKRAYRKAMPQNLRLLLISFR